MSCRWMPPSNGSFITNTSPGRSSSPHFASSVDIACGTEPRWNGTVTPWATVSPRGSQIAGEKSIPSRTTVEWAVRKIVVAISSAIEASALPTTCCVTGSTRAAAVTRAPARASPSPGPAGRSRRADRRPRAHRGVDGGAVEDGRAPPAARAPVRGEEQAAARAGGAAEAGEPERADLDRRARLAADAVEPLVLVLEPRDEAREVDRLVHLDLDLEALAAVAELRRPHPLGVGAERRLEPRADAGRVDGAGVEAARDDVVELGAGGEEAERAEEAGEGRDEHGAAAELLREPGRVDGAGAAVGDQ